MEPRVVRLLALFLMTQYPHSVTSENATSSLDINSPLSTEISPSSSASVSAASSILLDPSSSVSSITSSVSGALDSSASSISFSFNSALDSSASSISSSASSALDSSVSSISFSFHSALDSSASSISFSASSALDSSASSISSSFHSAVSVTEMTSSVTPTTVVVSPSSSFSTFSSTTTSPTANSSEQTASTSSSHSDLMSTMTPSINGTALAPTMPMTTQMSYTTGYMPLPSTNQLTASPVVSDMTTYTSTPIITATPTVTVTTPTTTPPTTTTPPPLKDISLAFVFSYNTSAVEGLNTSSVEYQQFRNRTLQALASIYNLTIPMDIKNLTISNGSLAVVLKITGTAKEISDNQNSIAALTRSIQTGQQNVTFDNLPATATQVFINGAKFDAQASPCVQAALIQACQYPLVCVVLADNITTTCGSEPHSKNKQGLLIGLPVGLLLYWFLCVIIAALIYTFVKQRRKIKTTDFNDVMLFDESLVPLDSFPKKKLQGLENPAMTEQSTGTNGSTEQHKM